MGDPRDTHAVAHEVTEMPDAQACAGHYRLTGRQIDVERDVPVLVVTHREELVRIIVDVSFDPFEMSIQIGGQPRQAHRSPLLIRITLDAHGQRIDELALSSAVKLARQERVRHSRIARSQSRDRSLKVGRGHLVFARGFENMHLSKVGKRETASGRVRQVEKRDRYCGFVTDGAHPFVQRSPRHADKSCGLGDVEQRKLPWIRPCSKAAVVSGLKGRY